MFAPERFEEDDDGTVVRDVITLALAGFMTMVGLVLPHVDPKAKPAIENAEMPGNLIVEARWQDGLEADVDLWVEAPGDVPVGYSNTSGRMFNLLRDDLGTHGGLDRLNDEVSYSRGRPAGEHVANLHLCRDARHRAPIPVEIGFGVKRDAQAPVRWLVRTSTTLRHVGDERTVFRLRLDGEGRLVPGSVTKLAKALRSGPGGG